MATVSPRDYKKNEAVAEAVIDNESKDVAAMVGIHALAKLTELMPHPQFLQFVNDAIRHATTGQPPQEDAGQSQQSSQSAPAQPQQSASPANGV
jgi:hypothetical protein